LFILTHIFLVLNFPGIVDADIGLGGKLKNYLMASCVKNIVPKNYYSCLIFLQITNEDIWDVFYWDAV